MIQIGAAKEWREKRREKKASDWAREKVACCAFHLFGGEKEVGAKSGKKK